MNDSLDDLLLDYYQRELSYLQSAVDKTGGPEELEAWNWLMERVRAHESGPISVRNP